jgi:uncharacterized membrane protein (UPF0127 family)
MRSRPVKAAFLGALIAVCAAACAPAVERVSLVVGGETFSVEVSRTDAARAKGLMGRSTLGPREGMLFVFDRDQHLDFWMKNTRVPLSIAFLSAEGKILEIADMEPFSEKVIRSRLSSRYALELRQGRFGEVGAGEGNFVILPEGFR